MATNENSSGAISGCGLLFTVLAGALSYTTFHSIGWAIVAGAFGPLYLIYYAAVYGTAKIAGLF
jgi:hypothetical protein